MVYILDLKEFTPFAAMAILTPRGQARHALVSLFSISYCLHTSVVHILPCDICLAFSLVPTPSQRYVRFSPTGRHETIRITDGDSELI